MKKQELSSKTLYFDGNGKYYFRSQEITQRKNCTICGWYKGWYLLIFSNVEHLPIKRVARGSDAD